MGVLIKIGIVTRIFRIPKVTISIYNHQNGNMTIGIVKSVPIYFPKEIGVTKRQINSGIRRYRLFYMRRTAIIEDTNIKRTNTIIYIYIYRRKIPGRMKGIKITTKKKNYVERD
jgi:hypothetical protein